MELYFYISVTEAEEAAECGISLESHFSRSFKINGDMMKCIVALLNPKDDPDKYNSDAFACLCIQPDMRYSFVIDGAVYAAGLAGQQDALPLNDYIYGSFRLPECLITSTVLPGKVRIAGRVLDAPLLYDNSKDFYIECLFEKYRENEPDFLEDVLYRYFDALVSENNGEIEKFTDAASGLAIFKKRGENGFVPLGIPRPR